METETFVTACPRCGGNLLLYSYKLTYLSRSLRYCQVKVPIEPDGFTVCDDLWGTKYEDGDQSTENEKTICNDCGRIDDLRYVENEGNVTLSVDILRAALHVLATKRPNKERKLYVMADLQAHIAKYNRTR